MLQVCLPRAKASEYGNFYIGVDSVLLKERYFGLIDVPHDETEDQTDADLGPAEDYRIHEFKRKELEQEGDDVFESYRDCEEENEIYAEPDYFSWD